MSLPPLVLYLTIKSPYHDLEQQKHSINSLGFLTASVMGKERTIQRFSIDSVMCDRNINPKFMANNSILKFVVFELFI